MAPEIGHRFVQPELGRTLRAIAARGARAFYEGEAAADIVAALRALGGLHTEEDFARSLRGAEFVEPIMTAWRGMEVYQCPPNGSGLHVLQLLGILDGFETPEAGPISAERYHRHIEAARLVYRDRDAFLADPTAREHHPDERFSLEVWSQNLFNEQYQQVAFNAPFQGAGSVANVQSFGGVANQIYTSYLAEPRTYGVTLRTNF